jgi:hypothetical protein
MSHAACGSEMDNPLREFKVWDANQLKPLLSVHHGVRRAFPAFLAPGDILASLADYTDSLPLDQLEPELRSHARTTMVSDGLIYFDEAGSADGATGTPCTMSSSIYR